MVPRKRCGGEQFGTNVPDLSGLAVRAATDGCDVEASQGSTPEAEPKVPRWCAEVLTASVEAWAVPQRATIRP